MKGKFNMFKKFMALLLAGTMVFSLTACSGNKNNGESETTTEEQKYYEIGGQFYMELDDYSKYVDLGDYSNLEIKVAPADVTDEQVQEIIDGEIEDGTTYEQVKEGIVKETDTVNMDYTGKIDGIAFEGGSATGYTYKIGDGFIDSLNDQLPGLEIGKEYELNVKFPDDYKNNEALAGKDTVFTVKINYVNGEAQVPEWNDEFVNEITDGEYTTAKDYEAYIREYLKSYNLQTQTSEFQQNTWKEIVAACKINGYPEAKLEEQAQDYIDYYVEYFKSYAEYMSMTYEELLELSGYESEDELKEECRKQAQAELEYIMIAVEIAKKENIAVTEDIYNSLLATYAANYSYDDVSEFEEEYGRDYIMESFVFEAVCMWLYDNNKMVESEDARPTEAVTTENATTESSATAEN